MKMAHHQPQVPSTYRRDKITDITHENDQGVAAIDAVNRPLVALVIVMAGLVTLFLCLRMWSQRRYNKMFALDNIVLLIAAVLYFAAQGCMMVFILIPFGLWLSPEQLVWMLKVWCSLVSTKIIKLADMDL